MSNTTWSLAPNASWATINSSNDGSYTMLVTAAPNPDATQRTMLFTFLAGTDMKTLRVTQDAADVTAIRQAETPSVIVYTQDGNVVVKSDAPVQRVAVYDVSSKLLKQLKGGNSLITISGLPKQQVMIVKVTSYELRVTSYELSNCQLTIKNMLK